MAEAIGLGLAAFPVVSEIVTEFTDLFKGWNDAEREDWIKGVVGRLVEEYPSHNVLVYKSGHWPEGPDDVQVQTSTHYADSDFSIMVFGSGKFVRDGDGGFINWCFVGKFDRNDNQVTFHAHQ